MNLFPSPAPAAEASLATDYLHPDADDVEAVTTAITAVTATSPGEALRALAAGGYLDVPLPASGRTWQRLRRIAEISAVDLSLGRLAEGHTDALAILAEANVEPDATALHGVWAANGEVTFRPGTGTMALHGERDYCSGAGAIDRALITAIDPAGNGVLALANLWSPGVHIQPGSWQAVGMADSLSSSVRFHTVPAERIGEPGFYLDRPGFWQGSVNVAAAWYGGALGLARAVRPRLTSGDPFAARLAAEIHVAIATMRLVLQEAASEIDTPCAPAAAGFSRAMIARHATFGGCQAVIDLASQAGGTGMATHDRAQARRLADLPVYLQQHHPSRDLPALGNRLMAPEGGER